MMPIVVKPIKVGSSVGRVNIRKTKWTIAATFHS